MSLRKNSNGKRGVTFQSDGPPPVQVNSVTVTRKLQGEAVRQHEDANESVLDEEERFAQWGHPDMDEPYDPEEFILQDCDSSP